MGGPVSCFERHTLRALHLSHRCVSVERGYFVVAIHNSGVKVFQYGAGDIRNTILIPHKQKYLPFNSVISRVHANND